MPPNASRQQSSPWRNTDSGLEVRVRLTPKARDNVVDGVVRLADGSDAVAVCVSAAPESGKANAALCKVLGKTWGVAKSDLTIIAGHKSRVKRVVVAGDAQALVRRLENWLKTVG